MATVVWEAISEALVIALHSSQQARSELQTQIHESYDLTKHL